MSSGSKENLGAYPLIIARPEVGNFEFTTEPDGTFQVTLEPDALEPGTVRFEVIPDLSAWEIPPGGFPVSKTAVEVLVDPILLALSVNSSVAAEFAYWMVPSILIVTMASATEFRTSNAFFCGQSPCGSRGFTPVI